jgi:polysaccharide deacetylase 2 family uncharacterized protein YibQ
MGSGRSRKVRPFGLSPLVLGFAAVACVVLGISAGILVDLLSRPPRTTAPPPVAAKSARPAPAPVRITGLPEEEDAPSLFDRAAPAAASPPRAEVVPRLAYAVPTDAPPSVPALAIVIDDVGLDRTRAAKTITLPGPLTLSLMTYAPDLPTLAQKAREGGHELMAHVPMEPRSPEENPGPRALRVTMDADAVRAALRGDLDHWQGYVGINNHMGSRFTGHAPGMTVVMNELKARGLFWLDSKTTTDSVGPTLAAKAGVPYLERDVFLDNEQTAVAVRAQLQAAIDTAKARGTAVAIGHPHDVTIEALREILPQLRGKGVALVPITEVLKRRSAAARG